MNDLSGGGGLICCILAKCNALHCIALQCIALHCSVLERGEEGRYVPHYKLQPRSTALHCFLHCISLNCSVSQEKEEEEA